MGCDCKKGFSKNMYDQGRQYITNPEFYINFGKNKTEINTPPSTDENNFINTRAKLGYGIYFIDNVAAGAHFDYMSWSIKNGTETTQTNFNLSPYIQAHIPTENWWNNMYFLVGGRFGSEKNKVTFGTSTNKDTFKESGWKAGIGANVFIADQTALDLYFQYRNIKTEEKDVPNPTVFKDKGIAFGAGFKYQF
jgi:opacity protein-like surface antigen